jgi:hypothetical protein
MATNKHFLQDRAALLLVSGMAFLTLAAIVLIILKLGAGQGTSNYIVSYRASLGIDRYTTGTLKEIVSFMIGALLLFGISLTLSYRAYKVKRELALVILALTIPLLLFLIVVSNALLVLR